MIEVNKYLDLDLSVLNVSAKILVELQKNDVKKYRELLQLLRNDLGEDAAKVFVPSLSFLFLLDKIEYLQQLDAFGLKDEAE